MKKTAILIILLNLIFSNFSSAQISPEHYLINLKDKKNSPYSIDKPQEFLSQRAIDRRNKYKIAINEIDIPVNKTYINSLKSIGLEIVNVSKWLNSVVVKTSDKDLIETAKELEFVKSVGLDKTKNKTIKKISKKEKSINKKLLKTEKSNYFDYGKSLNQSKMLNVNLLHNEGYRGENVHIAVLDAGFYKVNKLPAFDSIRANNQILGIRDFVDGDNEVYDADTHGMMVLSTMAGNIPGKLIGTAPKAKYYLIRTEQGATEYIIEEHNWVCGAEFADSVGVDIINSSLGYLDFDDNLHDHSYKDLDGNTAMITIGADIAASKGILVVTSAGNEGNSKWGYITAPGDADSVLTIGALTPDGEIAYFSSRGPSSDGRIKPDVCAQGQPAVIQGRSGNVSSANGTSFSSPIMAGAIACLWQAHPELNNMQIISAVQRSANRYSKTDSIFGYGIPDLYSAHIYLNTSGSIDLKKDDFIRAFPNPFENSINVEFIAKTITPPFNLEFSVFNTTGKKLFYAKNIITNNNYTVEKLNLDNSFAKGIYILQVKVNDILLQKRLMKL